MDRKERLWATAPSASDLSRPRVAPAHACSGGNHSEVIRSVIRIGDAVDKLGAEALRIDRRKAGVLDRMSDGSPDRSQRENCLSKRSGRSRFRRRRRRRKTTVSQGGSGRQLY